MNKEQIKTIAINEIKTDKERLFNNFTLDIALQNISKLRQYQFKKQKLTENIIESVDNDEKKIYNHIITKK